MKVTGDELNKCAGVKIRVRSYNQWFVISEKGDVLCHGNPTPDLDYHASANNFNPAKVVRKDTRKDALAIKSRWLHQCKMAKFTKKVIGRWTVRKGSICVVLDEHKGGVK